MHKWALSIGLQTDKINILAFKFGHSTAGYFNAADGPVLVHLQFKFIGLDMELVREAGIPITSQGWSEDHFAIISEAKAKKVQRHRLSFQSLNLAVVYGETKEIWAYSIRKRNGLEHSDTQTT